MAIAYINAAAAKSDSGPATTSAFDTTGATLLVVGGLSTLNSTPPPIADSKGNTWVLIDSMGSGLNPNPSRFWYCANPAVGSGHTFTAGNVTDASAVAAIAFSGTDTTAPLDGHSFNSSFANPMPSGSFTPASNDVVVVACATQDPANSAPTGYTLGAWIGYRGIGIAYKIFAGAPGAVNPAWPWGGTDQMVMFAAAFKPSGGGGGGLVIPVAMNQYRQRWA